MDTPVWVEGLAPLAPHFDGFLIDQWGVLHDGATPYPGAIEGLRRLMALGKTVVILSNSGKRAADNSARLETMGIRPGDYSACLSSGEAAWLAMKAGDPELAALGRRCVLVSRGGDRNIVAGLDVETVDDVALADFLLVSGVDEATGVGTHFDDLLAAAAHRGLPMLCANPDRHGIVGDRIAPTTGMLADKYEALGGRVIAFGKPYPAIYRQARRFFGDLAADRILAIGDSMENDIAGGRQAGHATLLIADGLHRHVFAGAAAADGRNVALAQLSQQYGTSPDWVTAAFHW